LAKQKGATGKQVDGIKDSRMRYPFSEEQKLAFRCADRAPAPPLMNAVKKAHVLHMLLDFRDQEGKNV